MHSIGALLVAVFTSVAFGLNALPTVCTWDPPILVAAGGQMSAIIDITRGSRCEAILRFTDSDFLPITWDFPLIPCMGRRVAQFNIPQNVPTGDAYVLWQCAGFRPPLSCSHITISNGTGDVDSLPLEQVGTVGCVVDSLKTMTTLVTQTNSNTVAVLTSSKTVTLATTSFLSTTGFLTASRTSISHSWSNESFSPSVSSITLSGNSPPSPTAEQSKAPILPSSSSSTTPNAEASSSSSTVTITPVTTTTITSTTTTSKTTSTAAAPASSTNSSVSAGESTNSVDTAIVPTSRSDRTTIVTVVAPSGSGPALLSTTGPFQTDTVPRNVTTSTVTITSTVTVSA